MVSGFLPCNFSSFPIVPRDSGAHIWPITWIDRSLLCNHMCEGELCAQIGGCRS